ncbi:hypothetical protein CKO_03637 [Citrobacter koseri ATCC BAA-895]|uniref:Uncharacterized protein n=1 Tax=Citrobacter koseri (strain ATCC BAA-895 / CDC 4225-83 / SGSC4696) TaxID=290338 RepID=A8AMK4_CITK8|nr:hypothetical protein CKO_03637 [Citrobacter koseri ATCC BAA-895]
MRIPQRFADGVHQRVIHDLHRQRDLSTACHLDALFQPITKTTARFIVGLLIVHVVTRKLDDANTDILRKLNGFTHDLQPLRTYSIIFAAQRKATMRAQAHGRHPHAGLSDSAHQRQALLTVPVEARQAGIGFIDRHFNEIEAQFFRQPQAIQPALPGGERFFVDAKRSLFRQHIRSLSPQLGDRTFKLTRGFNRRGGVANAATSNKDMDWNALKQRQVFQRQAAGHGHFKAHIRETFDRADIRFAPGHASGLCITATVINHLLDPRIAPLLRLLPGPVAGQFNLHIAVKLLRHFQRAFGGVDIRAADNRHPIRVGFKAHTRKNFPRVRNFGVSQHDLMRIERFQIAYRTYAFTHAQDGANFDNIDFFRDQAGRFVSVGQRLVIQRNLQHR